MSEPIVLTNFIHALDTIQPLSYGTKWNYAQGNYPRLIQQFIERPELLDALKRDVEALKTQPNRTEVQK